MSISANAGSAGRTRYLLLGSLALNLFFIGAGGAVALQHSSSPPLQPVVGIRNNMAQRLDAVIASLPADDAKIMRAELKTDAAQLAQAETDLRLAKETVRSKLRAEPYDPAAGRKALAQTSVARERFFQVLHDAVASATAKMSPAGRQALADWPVGHRNVVVAR
jgi:uncharacterized membrane protein